jgi:hypothetical protein
MMIKSGKLGEFIIFSPFSPKHLKTTINNAF